MALPVHLQLRFDSRTYMGLYDCAGRRAGLLPLIGGTDYRPMNGSGKHVHGSTLGSLPSLSADIGDFGERGSTHTLDGLAPSLPRVASRWRKRSRRKNRKKTNMGQVQCSFSNILGHRLDAVT